MERTLLFCWVLMTACSDPAPPSLPPGVTAPAEPSPSPSPAAEPSPAAGPPEPAVSAAEARPAGMRATEEQRHALEEARRLAHEHHDAEAWALLSPIADLGSASLRCEAGLLAHRAGDDVAAARLLDAGIAMRGAPGDVTEEERPHLAMCLYNRALLRETTDPGAAAEDLALSLALRPNATVEAHLRRLSTAPAVPPLSPSVEAPPALVGTASTATELAERLAEARCGAFATSIEAYDSFDVCVHTLGEPVQAGPLTFRTLAIQAMGLSVAEDRLELLVERAGVHSHVGALAVAETPGGFTATNTEVSTLRPLGPPDSVGVWLEVTVTVVDHEDSGFATVQRVAIVCLDEGDAVRCTGATTRSASTENLEDDEPHEESWQIPLTREADAFVVGRVPSSAGSCLRAGRLTAMELAALARTCDALPATGEAD